MADIIGFEKNPEPNIYISPKMQSLLIEILFGVYDITTITTKERLTPEEARRASDSLRHITDSIKEHYPEDIIDVMITLLKPRAVSGSDRLIDLYNELLRLKTIFEKERKVTLN